MTPPPPATLILLSGDGEKIKEHLRRQTAIPVNRIVSCSEKEITRPGVMLASLREGRPTVVAFGCKDLELQRYQFFLRMYLLLSGAQQQLIVDEQGYFNRTGVLSFLMNETPRFILEIIASIYVVTRASLELVRLRSPRKRTR